MHAAMSPDNMYLRFFSMSPNAAEQEAKRVCREPDSDHAALLAWQGDRLVGVGAYELAGKPGVAEVAFAVPDDMHGRGIASLLLEHLVWQARQRGLRAFTAETLAENSAMLRVFADVGLPAKRRISGGVVELTFPLPDGEDDYRLGNYLETVASRESRADVASLRPLLQPRSVAVVGPSRRRATIGRAILHNIVTGGFTGPVYAVNPHARTDGGSALRGVGRRPARAGGPGGDRGAAVRGARGGGAMRPPRGPGPDRDQLPAWAPRARNCWPSAAGMACGWSGRTVSA